jgi:hypothetical protein
MLESLLIRAQLLAERARVRMIDRLAHETPPPGVAVTRQDDGVMLSGQGLRRRRITDARLRSFGK